MPYTIKNMVGDTSTRVHRWMSPFTHRSKQIIGPYRLLPGESRDMTEELYKLNESGILQKVRNGELMVITPDGTTITSMAGGTLVYRSRDGKVVVQPPSPAVQVMVETPAPIQEEPEPVSVKVEPKVEESKSIKPERAYVPEAPAPMPEKHEKSRKGKPDAESKKSHGSH